MNPLVLIATDQVASIPDLLAISSEKDVHRKQSDSCGLITGDISPKKTASKSANSTTNMSDISSKFICK